MDINDKSAPKAGTLVYRIDIEWDYILEQYLAGNHSVYTSVVVYVGTEVRVIKLENASHTTLVPSDAFSFDEYHLSPVKAITEAVKLAKEKSEKYANLAKELEQMTLPKLQSET